MRQGTQKDLQGLSRQDFSLGSVAAHGVHPRQIGQQLDQILGTLIHSNILCIAVSPGQSPFSKLLHISLLSSYSFDPLQVRRQV